MDNEVFNFKIDLNWQLLSTISIIDRFDANWSAIERKEKQSLKHLKSVATVSSVGASTRIEGSILSDDEVDVIIKNIDYTKLEDRDTQEVVGYFEALELVFEEYENIELKTGNIQNLHKLLLKHSKKDVWHKGGYKQHSNAVEAKFPDGTTQIIFKTTEPGIETENAMNNLIEWYRTNKLIHPMVKCAVFTYEFLSIHPFQDGNGRLSRILSSLLLLKNGYKWIEYISFEHEIEDRKLEYYSILRGCQSQRPNENITEWIHFFLDALKNIQLKLTQKLQIGVSDEQQYSPRENLILQYIERYKNCKSGDIAKALNIPRITIVKTLGTLLEKKLIVKYGTGAGTYYTLA